MFCWLAVSDTKFSEASKQDSISGSQRRDWPDGLIIPSAVYFIVDCLDFNDPPALPLTLLFPLFVETSSDKSSRSKDLLKMDLQPSAPPQPYITSITLTSHITQPSSSHTGRAAAWAPCPPWASTACCKASCATLVFFV